MKLFKKKRAPKADPGLVGMQRCGSGSFELPAAVQPFEKELP